MENNISFTQLRGHLFGLTEDEQDDVLAFYREYAADAGLRIRGDAGKVNR